MRFLAVLAVFVAGFSSASAFDRDDVARWAAAMPPLMEWSRAHRGEVESPLEGHMRALQGGAPVSKEHIEALRAPFALSAGAIRDAGLASEPTAIVQEHGFAGLDDWADLSDRIFHAYAAQKTRAQGTSRATFEGAVDQIKRSDTLSEARKATMINRIELAMLMIDMIEKAPENDIQTVKQHLSVIEPILGNRF